MAEQITNVPAAGGDGGGGMGTGMVVGVIVVILIIIGLFIIFGRGYGTPSPAAPQGAASEEATPEGGTGAEIELPSAVDLNVNQSGEQPAGGGEALPAP